MLASKVPENSFKYDWRLLIFASPYNGANKYYWTVIVLQVVLPSRCSVQRPGITRTERNVWFEVQPAIYLFEWVRTCPNQSPNLSFGGVLYYNCKCFTTHLAFLIDLAKILCPDTNSPARVYILVLLLSRWPHILHSYATRADVQPVLDQLLCAPLKNTHFLLFARLGLMRPDAWPGPAQMAVQAIWKSRSMSSMR